MNSNIDIVGLGYCGLDYLSLVPRIPVDSKVEIRSGLVQGGGPAATAIFTAQRLGAATAFAGVVGPDERGREIVRQLADEGVDTVPLKIRAEGESPVAFCWVDERLGHRSIAWSHGTAASLTPDEIEPDLIASAKLLHLDGHQTAAAIRAAEIARTRGVTVSIDAGTAVVGIDDLLPLCDVVIASAAFAEATTGMNDPESFVRQQVRRNCRFAATTLGTEGCVGFDGHDLIRLPAFDVDVVDTTGAGDVFHGAFACHYVNGGGWRECLRFASAVAALKCTKFGGRTGIPTRNEAEKFLKEHADL